MRLTNYEINSIKKAFKESFEDGKIYLFGSRIDDNLKGGDIDLYVVPKYQDRAREDKVKFLIKLYEYIGEQKIDIVIAKDKNRLIEQQALKYGVNLMDNKIKLQKYLQECYKHKIRIEKYYERIKDIFPLSPKRYESLNDNEIIAIDGYIFRFSKLQDTLGEKVFKLIVSEYVEDINKLPFLDILNKLEQIGLIEAKTWKKLRAIRNDIAHQYDDESEEMAESLNNIISYKDELLKVYNDIAKFSKEKFNIEIEK